MQEKFVASEGNCGEIRRDVDAILHQVPFYNRFLVKITAFLKTFLKPLSQFDIF